MAMYSCEYVLKNMLNPGNKINPMDQKSSNIIEVIIFAFPPVISATVNFRENNFCLEFQMTT